MQFQISPSKVYHTSMFQLVQGHFCLYHKQSLNTGWKLRKKGSPFKKHTLIKWSYNLDITLNPVKIPKMCPENTYSYIPTPRTVTRNSEQMGGQNSHIIKGKVWSSTGNSRRERGNYKPNKHPWWGCGSFLRLQNISL